MPNWCYQNVLIAGSKKDRKQLLNDLYRLSTDSDGNKVEEHDIEFASLLIGDNSSDALGEFPRVCDFMVYRGIDAPILDFYFSSAWDDTSDVVRKVSRRYPNLVFGIYYSEESQAFVGWKVFHRGFLIDGDNYPVNILPPELQQMRDYIDAVDSLTENDMDGVTEEDFYEAQTDWYNDKVDMAGNECNDCLLQFAQHLRNEARRQARGSQPREFVYEPA